MLQPVSRESEDIEIRWSQVRACSLLAHCEIHRELGSTNTRGMDLAANVAIPLPALVLAERQSQGRGRGANQWWSDEGSLTFSLMIGPPLEELPQRLWPLLSLATGLAVCDALVSLAGEARLHLKWPNDVYCNGRKLCGELIESPGNRPCLVIGVGINVNNSLSSAPEEIRRRATSLRDETKRRHDLEEILLGFLQTFAARQRQLGENPEQMLNDWRARCLLSGRWIELEAGSERVRGECQGIDQQGALLVRTSQGTQSFVAGTVVEWR